MRNSPMFRRAAAGRRGVAVLAAAALAATLGGSVSASAAATAAAPRSAATAAVTSGNLLVDAGAESVAQCSSNGLDGMTVPGWTITSGEPNAVCYGASGYPDANTAGSPTRAKQFFDGGATGDSGLSQTADVSAAAGAIDAGGVPFNLSGWLGGYGAQNDRVGMTATFLNAAGASLGSSAIAPVTSTDRGLSTKFLQRSATGTLPAGTRAVKVDLAFTWTAGNTTDGYADDLSLTIGASVPAPALTAPASAVPAYDHVFLVYMENQDYSGIVGNSSAPYINSLIPSGTVLSQSYATTHPSDPNYVALAGGGLYGLHDNSVSTTTINAPHVGNSVDNAGKTWKAYLENANGNCDYSSHGYYAPDDVPFTYFQNFKSDESATGYCGRHDQPLGQMTTDLASTATTPDFVWFEPDDCDDMEACGVAAGDTWLSHTLPTIFHSPAWTQQKSLLILTFDEGATKSYGPSYPNRVPTLLLGSQASVKAGYTSSQRTDQYGLLRTVDKALGLAPLTNNDAYAATVNDAWQQAGASSLTTTGASTVVAGSAVSFSYATSAANASSTNWVGLYKAGDTPGVQNATDWQYAAGTGGSVTFTANYAPGTYQAYYFADGGYTALAGPVALTVISSTPTLSTATPSVANGSSITFSYTTPPATQSAKNWIGFYKPGDTPGSQSSTAWQYTPGLTGTATFTANYGKGTWQVYYFSNDGYTVLAGPVTVTLT